MKKEQKGAQKIVEKCESAGFFENTVFVILGDHGFILSDYNQNLSIELASYYIPCLIIAPGLDPAINSRTAIQTDIVPTILDLLGGSFIILGGKIC